MPRTATRFIGISLPAALLLLGGLFFFSERRPSPPAPALASSVSASTAASARPVSVPVTVSCAGPVGAPTLSAAEPVLALPAVVRERNVPVAEVIPGLAGFAKGLPWSHFSPRAATLHLFPDVTVEARLDESRYDGAYLSRTWTLDGSKHGFAASSASDTNMQWFVTDPLGSDYSVEVDVLGRAIVREMDARKLGRCAGHFPAERVEGERVGLAALGAPTESEPTPLGGAEPAEGGRIPQPLCMPDEILEGKNIVSILFVYGEAAMQAIGGEEALQNRCNLAVVISNKDLANSRVPCRYRRAGFLLLNAYGDRARLVDDMKAAFSLEPHASLIAAKRAEVGADLVSLISRAPGERQYIGFAAHGGVGVPAPKNRAQSALRWDAVLWSASHEFGHNVGGLQHERAIEGMAGEQSDSGAFGYVVSAVKASPLDLAVRYGTVMAYGGTQIHQFSNPAVLYDGVPTGLPDGHPRAANAARALAAGAAKVSAYEPEIGRVHLDHAALVLEIAPGMKIEEGIPVYNESPEALLLTVHADQAAWLEVPKTLAIAAHATATLFCRIDASSEKLPAPGTVTIRFLQGEEERTRLALAARPAAVQLHWPYGSPTLELSPTQDVRKSFGVHTDFDLAPEFLVSVQGAPEGVETVRSKLAQDGFQLDVRAARGTRLTSGTYPLTLRYDAGGQVRYFSVDLAVKGIEDLPGDFCRGEFINLSTRGWVGRDDEVMIAGVVIQGGAVTLLARALGPSLAGFGVTGVLPDPVLQVFRGSSLIARNDDWELDPRAQDIRNVCGQVGAVPGMEKEAALLLNLEPGSYTFHVLDMSGGTGVGMVELFLLDDSEGHLVNLSTRALVGDGEKALVAGFVREGDDAFVLARGVGPGLAALGLETAIVDPTLTMFRGSEQQMYNDDWSASSLGAADSNHVFEQIGAFSLPEGSADASEVLHVRKGSTTLQVQGRNSEGGVAVVEVFEMP